MKHESFQTTCICGGAIEAEIAKPTRLQFSVANVKCPKCQSRYMVKCRATAGREHSIEIETIELTAMARKAAAKKIDQEASA